MSLKMLILLTCKILFKKISIGHVLHNISFEKYCLLSIYIFKSDKVLEICILKIFYIPSEDFENLNISEILAFTLREIRKKSL